MMSSDQHVDNLAKSEQSEKDMTKEKNSEEKKSNCKIDNNVCASESNKEIEEEKKKSDDKNDNEAKKDEKTDQNRNSDEAEVIEGNWVLPEVNLKMISAKTGEEDEKELWVQRARLYRWKDKEWKERGLGDAKLLKDSSGKVRFLLRQEKTGKIVANHYVVANNNQCILKPNAGSKEIYVWSALDCSEEEKIIEQFAIKFRNADIANEFVEIFTNSAKAGSDLVKNKKW